MPLEASELRSPPYKARTLLPPFAISLPRNGFARKLETPITPAPAPLFIQK